LATAVINVRQSRSSAPKYNVQIGAPTTTKMPNTRAPNIKTTLHPMANVG
jgi:hypothetical protein